MKFYLFQSQLPGNEARITYLGKLVLAGIIAIASLVADAQPVISNFSPSSGTAGTVVTITGTNFSSTAASNIVFFGTGRATVSAATSNSITAVVPPGASYQPITVTTGNQTGYSAKPFLLTFSGGAVTPDAYSFAARVDSVYGLESNDLTVSDFNGDNRPDLAVVDRLHNTVSIYLNTSTGGQISVAPKIDLITGSAPYHVSSGDLNGDGKPDLIVSNQADNTVSIYQNTSNGTTLSFAPAINLTTGSQPAQMAVKDIDGDGRPDLVVSNLTFPGSLSVFLNTGTGGSLSFASGTIIAVPGPAGPIALEDIDGDGKMDAVVVSMTTNLVIILKNTSTTGMVSFAAPLQFSTGSMPDGLAVGDLDGDKRPDIIVPNFQSGTVSVFQNTSSVGNISLSRTDYPAGSSPVATVISDADGDGRPDVLVLNSFASLSIYRNISNGGGLSLASKVDVASPQLSTGMAAVDMDGDGKPDIAGLSGIFRTIILKNNADLPYISSFSPLSGPAGANITISGSNFTGATAIRFGGVPVASYTINSSSTITAVLGTGASGAVSVTTGTGTGSIGGFVFLGPAAIQSFSPVTGSNGTVDTIMGSSFTGATAVSYGGVPAQSFTVLTDSMITAVVGNGASGVVSVTNPYGTGTLAGFTHLAPAITSFAPSTAGPGASISITGSHFSGAMSVTLGGTSVASFIVNSPTSITAIVGGGSGGDVAVTSTYGTGKQSGFTFISPPPPVITSFSPQSGVAGSSIVITGANFSASLAGNVVYFGATPGKVTAATANQLTVTVPTGATYAPFTVLNTNNHLTAYSRQPFRLTFPGGGTITPVCFAPRVDVYSDPNRAPVGVITADLDGDGKPDLVFLDLYQSIDILRNTGSAGIVQFAPVQVLGSNVTVNTSAKITVGDVDGDGKPDILYPTYTGSIMVLRNTSTLGAISFDSAVSFGASEDPQMIAIGDLDGDGKPEIVVANYGSSSVSVLRNTCVPGIISFGPNQDYKSAGNPITVAIGDLDGDGKPEIVLANTQGSNSISIFRNTSLKGSVSFSQKTDIPTSDVCKVVRIGDLNGDGKPDLVVTHQDNFAVIKNTSTGGSFSMAHETVIPSIQQIPQDFAIGDVDGDGVPDIAVSYWGGNNLALFKNNSLADSIVFGPEVDFNAGVTAWGIDIVDLDGDGRPDLATALPDYHVVDVIHNQANAPYITSFSPASSAQGGTVTITGLHFTGATKVQFGGVAASAFTVVNDTSITAVVGAGDFGSVLVTTPAGTYSYGYFTYVPPFRLLGFQPVNAGIGTVVTITGLTLNKVTGVSFGGVPATAFTVDTNLNTITAVVGNGASGYVKVTTTTVSDSLPGFNFFLSPVITSFTPTVAAQGTMVTIVGTNLSGTTAVSFGGVPASSFNVISPDTITAYVGAGSSGVISVTNPAGTASLNGFVYVPSPFVSSFTPTSGVQGTAITIKGSGLTYVNKVSFGGVPARSFTINSDSSITAIVDTGASGDLWVTSQAGFNGIGGFTFLLPPGIQSFSPAGGTMGDTIVITGTELAGVTAVSIGGVPAASFIIVSSTSIKAVVGSGASGAISLVSPGGTATLSGFTYYPAPEIDSFTPGKAAKGAIVTILGVHLTGVQAVSFGGVSASSFTVLSDSMLNAVVGIGASGNITVSDTYGVSRKPGFTFVPATTVDSLPVSEITSLALHPNPAHSIVVVRYPPVAEKSVLSCYDLTGRKVKQIELAPHTSEVDLAISDLGPGLYKVNWSDGKKQFTVTLMVW